MKDRVYLFFGKPQGCIFGKQCRYYHPNMGEVKKLENSHQYSHNSNYEENKQPIRSLQSDRVITAMTNARKSRELNVYREQKFMQENETKESEAYCADVNCYCRRQ